MQPPVVQRAGRTAELSGLSEHSLMQQKSTTRLEALLSKYRLTLYITGTSPRAKVAIANLQRLCENELEGQYELEIVDVLAPPPRAEDEKSLATPTLIKLRPPQLRRVIGDLSDKDKVLLGLEVQSQSSSNAAGPEAR